MVTATQRRRAVEHLKNRRISERRACRLVGFSRSAAWYKPEGRDDAALRARLKTLAEKYPCYGYPTLHSMLRIEGLVRNPKRTYRIYREEGLQVRTKRRQKLTRPRIPMIVPIRANDRGSMDFVSDQLAQSRPLPSTLVCDNGPEFTSKAMFFWARDRRIKLHFIQPGKPTQNAFVESFNGKFRDYCLNLHWFASLYDARTTISQWRDHYNTVRPHRSLGQKPPAVFAREAA